MGTNQYYPPSCPAVPKYRLFAQYQAPQTTNKKEEILEQLHTETPTIKVVFAAIAIGMGLTYNPYAKLYTLDPQGL